jgi:hypothetical protein
MDRHVYCWRESFRGVGGLGDSMRLNVYVRKRPPQGPRGAAHAGPPAIQTTCAVAEDSRCMEASTTPRLNCNCCVSSLGRRVVLAVHYNTNRHSSIDNYPDHHRRFGCQHHRPSLPEVQRTHGKHPVRRSVLRPVLPQMRCLTQRLTPTVNACSTCTCAARQSCAESDVKEHHDSD